MATTDFLLQPAAQPSRGQAGSADRAAHQRPTEAGSAFSAVYAQQQQRTAKAQQQQSQQAQQRQTAVQQEKQQQAARQAAAKTAAQPAKEKPPAASKQRADTQAARSEHSAKPAEQPQQSEDEKAVSAQSGKALPQDAEQQVVENDDELIDPLLLLAMAATPFAYADEVAGDAGDSDSKLLLATHTGLKQTDETLEGEELPSTEDEEFLVVQKQTVQSKGESSGDKAALLGSALGKSSEQLSEKSSTDKNTAATLLEGAKVAPETLLNNKAVTATESIRTDLQQRQDSLLPSQQVRQVLGPAVAMQQPGWTQQVTDKVMWMSAQNLQSAEIKLDPAELGRLDIKVNVGQEHTQITFTSAHAGVRDSLEAQMHRLREMLAQQGMADVDVNVSDQSQQQHAESGENSATQGRSATAAEAGDETVQHVTAIQEQHDGRLGLVDYYV